MEDSRDRCYQQATPSAIRAPLEPQDWHHFAACPRLAIHLEHIDLLDEQIVRLTQEVAERLRPFEVEIELLE